MKILILTAIASIALSAQASLNNPKSEQRICQKLDKRAHATCEKELIKECKEMGGDNCEKVEGDFLEGVQVCAVETELPFLIEKYNEKYGTNITCEEY